MIYLEPYKNLINFDRLRELHWCNRTMGGAIQMYRHLTGREVTLDELLSVRMTPDGVQALLFGALVDVPLADFTDIYASLSEQKDEHGVPMIFPEFQAAVYDGVFHYLPESSTRLVGQGDHAWPEALPDKNAGSFSLLPFQARLVQEGYRLDEIGQMTLRGMLLLIEWLDGGGSDEDALDWLK